MYRNKKIKYYFKITIVCFTVIIISSCDKNSDNSASKTNSWIQDIMEEVYLWEEYIPEGLNPASYDNSYTFFEKFIYEDDYWSWVSDDYYETIELYSGVSTTGGYEFYLRVISDNVTVIGVVEYVLPNSPAEEAGIKRGDIFTAIDGEELNRDNYSDLLSQGGTYTMDMAYLLNNTIYADTVVSITELENFQENPINMDTVYHIGGKTIGYFVYTSYLAEYIDEVDAVFAKFKAEGVTDLVIDLRYNSGGSVAAEEAMANLIVPTSAIGDIFQKSIYNDLYNNYFKDKYGDDFLNSEFTESANNINLSGKLIGLTGPYTASASEGLLNGLDPVCDLTLIGDTTYGKYTAMTVIADDDSIWAVIPIISKTTNKDDVSVKGGMNPDYFIQDNPLDGYQLGDIQETLLAKAIEEITGEVSAKSARIKPTLEGEKIGTFKNGVKVTPLPSLLDWGNELLIKK